MLLLSPFSKGDKAEAARRQKQGTVWNAEQSRASLQSVSAHTIGILLLAEPHHGLAISERAGLITHVSRISCLVSKTDPSSTLTAAIALIGSEMSQSLKPNPAMATLGNECTERPPATYACVPFLKVEAHMYA